MECRPLLSLRGRPPGLALLLVLAPGACNALAVRIRLNTSLYDARPPAIRDPSPREFTGLKVWGAGMRTGGDGFCGCAVVPKPEKVYFETRDPAEIRGFVDLIHPRMYWWMDPPYKTCCQVTIDLLRGEKRVFWMHLKSPDPTSSLGLLPLSSGSMDDIEAWLKERGVRERIQADLTRSTRR